MAHRDRGAGRERERERDRYGDRRDRDTRDPVRERELEYSGSNRSGLNEFFVPGDGIHREVMQRELCKYLGSDALSRPGTYNGQRGYIVTALRPFTPKMIEDLQILSQDYEKEREMMSTRGFRGEYPYSKSRTMKERDAMGYEQESRYISSNRYPEPYSDNYPEKYQEKYAEQYSEGRITGGYPAPGGYPQGITYPTPQVTGYSSGPGYQPISSYSTSSIYPPGSSYPPTSGYPPASGYPASGYTSATVMPDGRNNANYIYTEGSREYPPSSFSYQQPSTYPGGAQANPRTNYAPYVSSPQDPPLRGVTMDDRPYEIYGSQISSGQPGRGTFPAPSRGTPTQYDPPQPRDGGGFRPDTTRERRK